MPELGAIIKEILNAEQGKWKDHIKEVFVGVTESIIASIRELEKQHNTPPTPFPSNVDTILVVFTSGKQMRIPIGLDEVVGIPAADPDFSIKLINYINSQ